MQCGHERLNGRVGFGLLDGHRSRPNRRVVPSADHVTLAACHHRGLIARFGLTAVDPNIAYGSWHSLWGSNPSFQIEKPERSVEFQGSFRKIILRHRCGASTTCATIRNDRVASFAMRMPVATKGDVVDSLGNRTRLMAGLHRSLRRRPERRSSASGQKRRKFCAALRGLLPPVPEITDFVGHLGRDLAVEIDVLIETAHRHQQRIARLVIVAHFRLWLMNKPFWRCSETSTYLPSLVFKG